MERGSLNDKQTALLSDSHDVLVSPTRQRLQQLPPPRLPISTDDEDGSHALDDNKWRPLTPLYGALPSSPVLSSCSPPPPPSLSSLLVSRYQRRYSCLFLSLLLAAILYYYVITETTRLQSSFPPLLPAASLARLNNLTATQQYFGSSSLASNATHRTRVVYFILDGLRADTVSYPGSNSSSALAAFLATLPSADLLTFPLRNQLPTISISSWVCLVTGSTPSFHGRLGNDDTSIINPIASVFSSALDFDSPSGVSGSGFWSILLSPSYSPFHGDGTIPDDVDLGDPHYRRGNSAAQRDAAYDRRLHSAIGSVSIGRGGRQSRFDYELFLAYYDDVDAESHSFGGSSPEALEAVRAKAAYLQSAMAAVWEADRWSAQQGGVHWTTIYVLTSDHGHLDVGGHGGDAPNVHTVPIVVFSNQSGISSRPAAAFSLPPVPASYTPSTVDLATTIAALLGIPVPRESEGMFFPHVLAPFVASNPRRAFAHYVDLFRQKRAFVMEVADVLGQTQLLDTDVFSAASLASLTATPADGNCTRGIAALNSAVGSTLQVLQEVQAARLRSELITNWLLSSLLVFLLLLPLLCWWFNSRTFLSIRALFPQPLSAGCAHLSYLCGWCLVAAYRRVGGHAGVPFPVFYPLSPLTLRVNRLCAAVAVCLTVLWLLLMLAEFYVVFRLGYRPDPQWRWQFTLFNSEFDAYVMLFGFCMIAGLLLCGALHLLVGFTLRSRRVTEAVIAFLDLGSAETAGSVQTGGSVSLHAVQVSVLCYCLVQYLSFFSCLFVLLLLYAQSFHCVLLPGLSPINVITPGIWNARFQSVSIACMLMPAVVYLAAASWWSAWRLHGHMWQPVRDGDREDDEGIKVRQQDSWRGEKEAVLRLLAGLRAPLTSQPLAPLAMMAKGEDSSLL